MFCRIEFACVIESFHRPTGHKFARICDVCSVEAPLRVHHRGTASLRYHRVNTVCRRRQSAIHSPRTDLLCLASRSRGQLALGDGDARVPILYSARCRYPLCCVECAAYCKHLMFVSTGLRKCLDFHHVSCARRLGYMAVLLMFPPDVFVI